MTITKKMDSIGRIVIPKDLRRTLNWGEGDEIEINLNPDGTILLRKYEDDTAEKLKAISLNWSNDEEVQQRFNQLMSLIESKN